MNPHPTPSEAGLAGGPPTHRPLTAFDRVSWLSARTHWRFAVPAEGITTEGLEAPVPLALHIELTERDVAQILRAARTLDAEGWEEIRPGLSFESIDGQRSDPASPDLEGHTLAVNRSSGLQAHAYDEGGGGTCEATIEARHAVEAFPDEAAYYEEGEAEEEGR